MLPIPGPDCAPHGCAARLAMARVLVARPAAHQRSARMPLRSMALIPVPRSVPGRPHRRGCRGNQCLRPHCPVSSPLHPLRPGIIHFLCANGVRLRARRAFEDPLRKVSSSRAALAAPHLRAPPSACAVALCSPQGRACIAPGSSAGPDIDFSCGFAAEIPSAR